MVFIHFELLKYMRKLKHVNQHKMHQISLIIRSILGLFFPKTCTICHDDLTHKEYYLCLSCFQNLPFLDRHPSLQHQIQKVFWGRVKVHAIYALLNYQAKNDTQKILQAIKYQNKPKMAEYMGQLLSKSLPQNQHFDYIVPIPLHPRKARQRGYNQSLHLAKGLQSKTGIPILNDMVVRSTSNPSQTQFSKYDRWQNVNRIFIAPYTPTIKDKHILIIDDVLTTGATIESCAHAILETNTCTISVVTLAVRV